LSGRLPLPSGSVVAAMVTRVARGGLPDDVCIPLVLLMQEAATAAGAVLAPPPTGAPRGLRLRFGMAMELELRVGKGKGLVLLVGIFQVDPTRTPTITSPRLLPLTPPGGGGGGVVYDFGECDELAENSLLSSPSSPLTPPLVNDPHPSPDPDSFI
jgi:hypothetical protein